MLLPALKDFLAIVPPFMAGASYHLQVKSCYLAIIDIIVYSAYAFPLHVGINAITQSGPLNYALQSNR